MMVMMVVFRRVNVTMLLKAGLSHLFQFQRGVGYAVLPKLLAHPFFHITGHAVGDDVHRYVIMIPVHCPEVQVMNARNALDFAYMLLYLIHIYGAWRLFKKYFQRLPKSFCGVYQNEYCNAYRHQRVNDI